MDEQKKDENLLSERPSRGPILWFAICALPLVLGLVISFDDATHVDEVGIEAVQEQVVQQKKNKENMIPGRFADMGIRRKASKQVSSEEIFCPVDAFTGQVFTEEIRETIKASRRPYRVIEQLKMYTNDYVPERINVRLYPDGRIETVWCG